MKKLGQRIMAALLAGVLTVGTAGSFSKAEQERNANALEEKVLTNETVPQAPESDFDFDEQTGTILGYKGTEKVFSIPSQINGRDVRAIGREAFKKRFVEKVVLPDTVTRIEFQAFTQSTLKEVILSKNLEKIGKRAFYMSKLDKIDLPTSLKTIEEGAFMSTFIETIALPEHIKILPKMAFMNCSKLKSVQWNDGLEVIGEAAFRSCLGIKDIRLPKSVQRVQPNAFMGTSVKKIVVEGKEGEIFFFDYISDILKTIEFESPEKKSHIDVAAFGKNKGTVDLGTYTVLQDEEAAQALAKLPHKYSVFYVNKTDANDIKKEVAHDIIWEKKPGGEEEYIGKGVPFTHEETALETGYYRNDPNDKVRYTVKIVRQSKNWDDADFTYSEVKHKYSMEAEKTLFGITGFSEQGLKRLENNKKLVVPESVMINGQKKTIEFIGESAFAQKGLQSVTFPKTEARLVIQANAFLGNALTEAVFEDGLNFVGPSAFKDNLLTKVTLPSTLFATGSRSFMNNQIETLEISPWVNKVQFDNYSFAHNKMKSVDLPYSIFKIRDFVFKSNPGEEALKEKPDQDDAPNTGIVHLRTLNKDHLSTDTYISTNSKYHKVILTAQENSQRDALFEEIKRARDVVLSDYPEQAREKFLAECTRAQDVFLDASSTQEALDEAYHRLVEAYAQLRQSAADRVPLRDLLVQAQALQKEAFTSESYEKLKRAMEKAQAVLNSMSVTQEEIDTAYRTLKQAMDELVISPNYIYDKDDFVYKNDSITGFSAKGKNKFKYNKNLVLPDSAPDGTAIKAIGDNAFKVTEGVEYGTDVVFSPNGAVSVKLPGELESIGANAFQCNNFTKVDFPQTLRTIGGSAFNGNRLQEIVLPDKIDTIENGTFSLNPTTKLVLPKGLKKIEAGAFSRNIYLTRVDFPETVEEIGSSAFMGVPLKSLRIPPKVKIIERYAFNGHRLSALHIPDTVEQIKSMAFAQNVKFRTLKKVEFEEGLLKMDAAAFKAGLIKETKLPNSLKELAKDAFKDNYDENKVPVVVKLWTYNPEHLKFNTEQSLKNQEVILKEQPKPDPKPDPTPTPSPSPKPEVPGVHDDSLNTDTQPSVQAEVTRTSGLNRYLTAIEVSKKTFAHADTVILAGGENFADALVATALAKMENGPILLSMKDQILPETLEEINRLGAKKIILVGGESSISGKVEKALPGETERLSGKNREATALIVARTLLERHNKGQVILADARQYPDSLSIAPYAAKENLPILYIDREMSREAKNLLDKYKIEKAIIIGGESSVPKSVERHFKEVVRYAGKDRYETSEIVLKALYKPEEIVLCSGENYPDALTGAVYAANKNAPILLIPKEGLKKIKEKLPKEVKELTVIGGTSSIENE